MKSGKALTIRLSADQAEALSTVAAVEDKAMSEVIRSAISEHIENRRHDPKFQKGLVERIERAQELLAK